jgi:hypothetical protein
MISPEGTAPGTKWKRRQLQLFPCWQQWYASEKKQLDEMEDANILAHQLQSQLA